MICGGVPCGQVSFMTMKNFLNSSSFVGIASVASWIWLLSVGFSTVIDESYLSISEKSMRMFVIGLNLSLVRGSENTLGLCI